MKTGLKKKTMIAALTLACMCSLTGGAILAASAEENEPATSSVQTLNGFECKGVSVNAEEIGMRFEFNLSGDAVSYNDKTAGVVYMPYDLYAGDINDFVKGTDKALTANFTWKDNTETADDTTDKVGYTYMDASVIPSKMYNRVLLVRGYIEDGDNVYYTEPVKTSMAYSAWKGIDVLGETYEDQLHAYMGPYTLTYGDGENDKVGGLYYGDTFTLPTQIDGHNVDKWYWNETKTTEIKEGDYATGSMNVYYKLQSFTVSGTLSGADNFSTLKVYEGDTEINVTVSGSGYSLSLEGGEHNLTFSMEGYYANVTVTVNNENVSQDVILKPNTFVPGTYLNSKGSAGALTDNEDGTYTVTKTYLNSDLRNVYSVLFPNTATNEAFIFEAEIEKPINGEVNGIQLSAGGARFHIGFQNTLGAASNCSALVLGTADSEAVYKKGLIRYNDNAWLTSAFGANVSYKPDSADGLKTITVRLVVTQEKIECYVWNQLRFSFTKDSWTDNSGSVYINWSEGTVEGVRSAVQSICFGEDGKINTLCVGILGHEQNNISHNTVKYTKLSYAKYAVVSGTISGCANLQSTKLTVDGSAYGISVNNSGFYTAAIPEGTHTLVFKNEADGTDYEFKTENVEVKANQTNEVNVTLKSKVDIFKAGSYQNSKGSVGSFKNNEDGTYTVTKTTLSGEDRNGYSIQFPNTATNEAFTFVAEIAKPQAGEVNGISITSGAARFHIGFQNTYGAAGNCNSLVLGSGNNYVKGDVVRYNDDNWLKTTFGDGVSYKPDSTDGKTTITVKLVVTQEKIECYVWDRLRFSFTKDSWTDETNSSVINWDEKDTAFISAQAQTICFDSESGKINTLCVGIQGFEQNTTTNTTVDYKLSWQKDVDSTVE